ncbi:hypothetical protein ABZ553_36370 [Streptomyces sparsogenes]|uniref:hypothetical protein n=1 Tax=Streptomyces sparsogenes TaxID=67365 RepID=UPI0033EA152D
MTEFTTALVAGLIGLVGTVTGAAATAWAAKIGANKNAEAVRGQAQDQATSEHAHWLRQQRLASYEGFLDAWDECIRKRTELTRPVDDSAHDALRMELSRSASCMMERARRISLLGPEEVSLAAESISRATLENIEKEDKYGQYIKSALLQVREQERQIRELSVPLQSEELREVLRHVDDLERLQELYSVEQLEKIVDQMEHSVNEGEELHRRLVVLAELGREVNDEAKRFLENFKRNIQVAEESRVVFTQTVRNAIASPSMRNDHLS